MRLRTVVVPALLAVLYPLVLWQKEPVYSAVPFRSVLESCFWIVEPLLLAFLFFASSVMIRQTILRYMCIIAASFVFALAAAELFIQAERGIRWGGTARWLDSFRSQDSVYIKSGQATLLYELDSVAPDPLLGFGPKPGAKKIAARRVMGDKVLYDILYTREEDGRRITPDRGDKADTAVLLFGCSFTVGEGVNDRESFAWRLGEILGDKFQVFNYGFHGYGSQQMPALVESGRLDALMRRYKHVYAFYLTIHRHEKRCVGLDIDNVSRAAPRYTLENGVLKRAGTFKDSEYRLLVHSRVHDRIYNWVLSQRVRPETAYWLISGPLDTHAAIIARASHELTARYNAHPLTVAIWPKWPAVPRMEPPLRAHGVPVCGLTGVMPDFASAPEKYEIPDDFHPNAQAHARIAEALAECLLKDAASDAPKK